MPDLSVRLGHLELKNPVVCASGEWTASADGMRAALERGAAAVVAKSANESEAARRQLETAEYVLFDERWEPLPWGPAPRSATLLNRSGLVREPFDSWVETLVALDRDAAERDAYVVASLIVGDPDEAVAAARTLEEAGLRWLELNVGAPHGSEAPAGTIRTGAELVSAVREAVRIPLTAKIAGQGDVLAASEDATEAGADHVCLATRPLGFVPDLETQRPALGTFGAVGGAWLLPLTLRWVAKARQRFGGEIPIVGTGGARDGRDVARFLLAGASAVQLGSVVFTDGFDAIARALDELTAYLDEQGASASELVGRAADAVMTYEEVANELDRNVR